MGTAIVWRFIFAVTVFLVTACTQPEAIPTSTPTPTPSTTLTLAPEPTEATPAQERLFSDRDIITLLPFDAIPAVLEPRFLDGEQALKHYSEEELVLGLSINGDHRAYSIPYLSTREIVNDVVGGMPVAVTW